MNKARVNSVVEQLMRAGFSMSTAEFFETTVYAIMKKYGIQDKLTVKEYFELLRQLIDICATQDMKEMGYAIYDPDDLRYK